MRRHAKSSSAQPQHRKTPKLLALLLAALLTALVLGVSLANATAPSVTIENATEVGFDSAKATGHVDPADKETSYRFEYATDAQFTNSEWAEATHTGHGSVPAGAGNTEVSTQLQGLSPGTTYHLRLLAGNEDGEDSAVAATFTTEAVSLPEAEIDPAGAITGDSAHLSGTVNSGGTGPGEKAGTYRFTCSPACPGIEDPHEFEAKGIADGADHAVEADATGLLLNTKYTVTLTAQNAAGQESDQTTFTTSAIAPQANTAFVAPRTTTTARLNAYVVPNNSATTYYFEYGPDDCSANPCTSVPADSTGDDMQSHLVSQELEGLSESTTYHYRVVAENAGGTTVGADKTFQTRSAAEMYLAPRGIELVNPPDKGNQHIEPVPLGEHGEERFLNTPDGEHAAWAVFGGAPGGTTGSRNSFLSTRGPSGWSSVSMIGPPEKQYGDGDKRFTFLSASPDLSRFILSAEEGFFTATDFAVVRADRAGNQEVLLTVPYTGNDAYGPVDISRDARHVLYVSQGTEGHLYDYGSGTPEEVGLMADDTPPDCGVSNFYSRPGYDWIATTDASRVFFMTSGDACSDPPGLYVRNRETEDTIQLTPQGGKGEFIRATPDGRSAIFLTNLALVGEDSNSTPDLYRWWEDSPTKCLTCSVPNANVGPDVGVADDLGRVYFQSPNELVPGERKGGGTYVVLADGSIHFAGRFPTDSSLRARYTPDGSGFLFRTPQYYGSNPDKALTTDEIADNCPSSNYLTEVHECVQLYYYDDTTRSIECISCVKGGVTKQDAAYYGHEISDDGETIVFETPEKLVPSDINGGSDIYQWHNGQLGLITDGVTKFSGGVLAGEFSKGAPTVRGISANGRDVFFSAAGLKTGFEQDGLSNLYDARIGGGFTPPGPPVHCDGDSCQGPLEVPPGPVRSASSTFSGNGNVTGDTPRCRGAKVRRRGRCVSRRGAARCRKGQAAAKRRCTKRQVQAGSKRRQGNDRGGAK